MSTRTTSSSCWRTASPGLANLLKERVTDLDELVRARTEVALGGSVLDRVVVETLIARRAHPKTARWSTFATLMNNTAAKQPNGGKCINPGREGYFQGRGIFVSVWFNPTYSDKWLDNRSACYSKVAKAGATGAAHGQCKLVNVDFRSVKQIIKDSGGAIRVEPAPTQRSGSGSGSHDVPEWSSGASPGAAHRRRCQNPWPGHTHGPEDDLLNIAATG
jgi:hypothetical protein